MMTTTTIHLLGGKTFQTEEEVTAIETGYAFTQGKTEYEIPWTSVLYITRLEK